MAAVLVGAVLLDKEMTQDNSSNASGQRHQHQVLRSPSPP